MNCIEFDPVADLDFVPTAERSLEIEVAESECPRAAGMARR
jgi:hypothetical protein